KIGRRLGEVGRPVALEDIHVDAVAVDVAHVEPIAVFRRIGVTVEIVDATVSGFLVLVLDDRVHLPGIGRIPPALAVVVAGLDQMPEMVDHAGADEGAAFGVKRNAPGIARSLAKDLEVAGARMNTEHRTGEVMRFAAILDLATVENAVEAIEPA